MPRALSSYLMCSKLPPPPPKILSSCSFRFCVKYREEYFSRFSCVLLQAFFCAKMAKLRSKITQLFGKTQPNFRKTQVKIAIFCKTWNKISQKHDPNFGFTKYGFAKTQVKIIKTQLCEFRQEVPNLDSCTNKKPDKTVVVDCTIWFFASLQNERKPSDLRFLLQLSSDYHCINFTLRRIFPVAKTSPYIPVRILDWYSPG